MKPRESDPVVMLGCFLMAFFAFALVTATFIIVHFCK